MVAIAKDSSSIIRHRLQVNAHAARLIHALHKDPLILIATNPERLVADINERILCLVEILKRGNIKLHEIIPIYNLLSDDSNYPISGSFDKDAKENHSLLRGEAALAVGSFCTENNGNYSTFKDEFINTLTKIMEKMKNDRLFNSLKHGDNYYFEHFKYFLAALYLVRQDLAEEIMKSYSIKETEITSILRTYCPALPVSEAS